MDCLDLQGWNTPCDCTASQCTINAIAQTLFCHWYCRVAGISLHLPLHGLEQLQHFIHTQQTKLVLHILFCTLHFAKFRFSNVVLVLPNCFLSYCRQFLIAMIHFNISCPLAILSKMNNPFRNSNKLKESTQTCCLGELAQLEPHSSWMDTPMDILMLYHEKNSKPWLK